MDATAVQQHRPPFGATMINLKPRISSTSAVLDANKSRVADVANRGDKGGGLGRDNIIAPPASEDPAALRARLKHRAMPPPSGGGSGGSSSSTGTATSSSLSTYDKVLDTARRVAELELQRAQDQIYIRTLEQTRSGLVRDAQSAARARAEAERAAAAEREARRGREMAEVARDEAVRGAVLEGERAVKAEERVRALERALRDAVERVSELEGVVEGEKRRREEVESGLEALVN